MKVIHFGSLMLSIFALAASVTLATPAFAGQAAEFNDVPAEFKPVLAEKDFTKRVEMIPMRDGVKLYTEIFIPKNAKNAPILMNRTPYNISARTQRQNSPSMLGTLPLSDELVVKAGYIRVYQDSRGKYGSEGDYVLTMPVRGPLNPTETDHSTDAWDTIEWLVKNLPESNGRVGMIGSSYEGFTTAMALLDPHPALKAAVRQGALRDA